MKLPYQLVRIKPQTCKVFPRRAVIHSYVKFLESVAHFVNAPYSRICAVFNGIKHILCAKPRLRILVTVFVDNVQQIPVLVKPLLRPLRDQVISLVAGNTKFLHKLRGCPCTLGNVHIKRISQG